MTTSNSLSHNKIYCANTVDIALLIKDESLGLRKKNTSYYNRLLLFNFVSTLANVCLPPILYVI